MSFDSLIQLNSYSTVAKACAGVSSQK